MAKNHVEKIICIGTSHQDSLNAKEFTAQHPNTYWTYGVHPSEYQSAPSDSDLTKIRDEKLVAIGEVGLDYHYSPETRIEQLKLFEQMLQLARDNNLPVSFHIREAFDDFFGIIANFPELKGVVHSFSDSKKNLKKVLENTDFYVGVNGLATYSTLPTPPLERILLETDAPFLAPVPYRGEQNDPSHILDIAKWLSVKLEQPTEIIAETTTKNAEKLFMLK